MSTTTAMDKAERCPECGYTDADARTFMDHHTCKNYPFFTQPGGYEYVVGRSVRLGVPAEQTASAKNLVSFPPFSYRIVNTCLELTFASQDKATSALGQIQDLRQTPALKTRT